MNAIASTRPVREDVYTRVTNKIIASLEQGVRLRGGFVRL
jgi:antirestriction protein ArdC